MVAGAAVGQCPVYRHPGWLEDGLFSGSDAGPTGPGDHAIYQQHSFRLDPGGFAGGGDCPVLELLWRLCGGDWPDADCLWSVRACAGRVTARPRGASARLACRQRAIAAFGWLADTPAAGWHSAPTVRGWGSPDG